MNLLASDFDGTLWFEDHMKEKDLQAIQEFRNHGNLFGLCSGRSLGGILRPSQNYDIDYDFYILLSGALIYNKDKEIIFEKKIPLDIVKEIYFFLNEQTMTIVNDDNMYQLNANEKYFGTHVQSIDEIKVKETNAFSFHFQKNEIEKATKATQAINEKFGNYVEAFQNQFNIDLTAKGCSKGDGVSFIQNYFHLNPNQISVIGDSWNDLPMLQQVKNSYTFTYAPKEVQTQAKYIVSDLYKCIENIK